VARVHFSKAEYPVVETLLDQVLNECNERIQE